VALKTDQSINHTVIVALSRLVFEILAIVFGLNDTLVTSGGLTITMIGGFNFQNVVPCEYSIVFIAVKASILDDRL